MALTKPVASNATPTNRSTSTRRSHRVAAVPIAAIITRTKEGATRKTDPKTSRSPSKMAQSFEETV